MEELTCLLRDVQGKEYCLRNPSYFSCVKSNDTPAESLKLVFCVTELPQAQSESFGADMPEIQTVEVSTPLGSFFKGICDEQSWTADAKGGKISVYARSRGAVLLDNEALPQEYWRVNLAQLFQKHIAPYGFDDLIRQDQQFENYTVGKGCCEWDAFANLCKRMTGKRPYVVNNWVTIGLKQGRQHRISGENQAVIQLKRTICRKDVISQVLIRGANGSYSTLVENAEAKRLGIQRKRYLIPSPQWAGPAGDAAVSMKESMEEYSGWKLCLPGLLDWWLGDSVILPQLQNKEKVICEIAWEYRSGSATTSVVLR